MLSNRIDILVNAARTVAVTDALNPDDASLDDLLEQNLLTAFRLSQAAARRMVKQADREEEEGPAGSIINLSSIAARRTHPPFWPIPSFGGG